jgi:glycosyltransferase involved in cell wall biosynthesis
MNWLIIEDALKDQSGHWLEFVTTFRDGLTELGDKVTILGPADATADTIKATRMKTVLPLSSWRMERTAQSAWKRAKSSAGWVIRSIRSIRKEVKQGDADIVFVPTVGIPHLVVWYLLIKFLLPQQTHILLYFMASPVKQNSTGGYEMIGMSGRIFFFLLKRLAGESRAGNLILATEAHPLSDALASLSGAAFHTLPQPVNRMFPPEASTVSPSSIVVGSYGPARHEKGADILIAAIEQYLASTSRDDIVFAVQWLQDFQTPEGEWVRISEALKQDRRFFQIDHLFAPGEYAGWLAKSSLALLPYGKEYALRGSRVIIEAMIHGIPIVVAKGTTLENHGLEFGAAVCCCQNSVDDLTKAIQSSIDDLTKLQEAAGRRAITATEYFSVRNFRNLLIEAF